MASVLPSPVVQLLRDCSDASVEVCGLVSVQLFAGRAPSALLLHDGSGTTAHAYLARAVAHLLERHPGALIADAALDGRDLCGRWLELDGLGRPRPHPEQGLQQLEAVLGLPAAEQASLLATARALHATFVPSLPDPAEAGPAPPGLRVELASDPTHRISGYLLLGPARSAAVVLHDADPTASDRVNAYLTSLFRRLPHLGGWDLAERSLRDPGEAFCRVVPAGSGPASAGLRSAATIGLAAAAALIGIDPSELGRLVLRISALRRWHSPFSGLSPLLDEPAQPPSGWVRTASAR
jgi:hypothetical protein